MLPIVSGVIWESSCFYSTIYSILNITQKKVKNFATKTDYFRIMEYNRREFIKGASVLFGSLLFFPKCSSPNSFYRSFTSQEISCLNSLCEQIIPADEDPGAMDAEVVNFIDKQIALHFPEEQVLFRKGIAAIQSYSIEQSGMPFEKLANQTQLALIKLIEEGALKAGSWDHSSQRQFFSKLVIRSMQGFYGSPRHGGNKDYVSYRMLRLDYPLVIGQNRYRK